MSLSEFLRNYRAEHELSMDDLAKRCGLSKPYISMLEKNRNSKYDDIFYKEAYHEISRTFEIPSLL